MLTIEMTSATIGVMELQTLFHKGAQGSIYQWRIWAEGSEIVTEYGQLDGQKVISRRPAQSKNVGRANATTPEAQAQAEALSEWKHKLDRKYVDTIEKVHQRKIDVMKAPTDKWEDTKKYVVYPADVQPKLDGARCLAYWEGDRIVLLSRGRKEWDLPHIKEQLKKVLPLDAMWDGELYFHGVKRQTIQSWITKHYRDTLKIGLHVYDVPVADGEEKPWSERRLDLEKVPMLNGQPHPDTPNIFRVPTFEVQSEEQVMLVEEQCVAAGYEGAMFRNRKGMYDWGHRSKNLLKIKRFEDAEFKVVDYKEGEGGHTGCVIWGCVTKDGGHFWVVPNGSLPERRAWFRNADQRIGQELTVKFQGYSNDGLPQIAKGIAFRLPEDMDTAQGQSH